MAPPTTKRLVELYAIGDRVEILQVVDEVEVWRAGEVVGHQYPAVWVRTAGDRKVWFVTNGKRIRPLDGIPGGVPGGDPGGLPAAGE